MVKSGLFSAMLLSAALITVHGLPTPQQPSAAAEESPVSEDSLEDNLTVKPWDPPFPGVKFGPEVGVKYDEIISHPKNFDDKGLLHYDNHYHRELRQISCYHKTTLIGLEELYTLPDGSGRAWTSYHGYDPTPHWTGHRELYVLQYHEYWSSVQYKICGGKITGINFKTSKNNGVSCGDYVARRGDGCEVGELIPDKGRQIIGLYGDANGNYLTPRKGIRGIGLITYWVGK